MTGVVEDCVNKVGVDLNTASARYYLIYLGITGTIAKKYRGVQRRKTENSRVVRNC